MTRMSKSANLSKSYTNHCIRATVATVLNRQGVDLLKIMSVTGHCNVKSLESYINEPTDNERRTLSAACNVELSLHPQKVMYPPLNLRVPLQTMLMLLKSDAEFCT